MALLNLQNFRRLLRSTACLRPTKQDHQLLELIRTLAEPLSALTDTELRSQAEELRQTIRATPWTAAQRNPASAFALAVEAVRRATGKTYYDVQLLGGLSLARGEIAQMQTGEGKTLTTALPAFFFSLAGRGVHVATTNAYLAKRDSDELQPVLQLLGVSVGVLPDEHDPVVKHDAYRCDVTFGTGYEFGFDFLRDQIALRQQPKLRLGVRHLARLAGQQTGTPSLLQRPHAFAVIDEADSVLIDEATMPLILSGAATDQGDERVYQLAQQTAESLQTNDHYILNEAVQSIEFTQDGWHLLHSPLRDSNVRGLRRRWAGYVENALRAKHFLQVDVDYVVLDQKVQIVDQHTGRIHEERSWREGLHQAVQIREGVKVSPENTVDGRVSRQRYFQFYDHICGMTGTATGNEHEFREFYGLKVREIPTHKPCCRELLATRCFAEESSRDTAIVDELQARHVKGQPVLVGTRTIRHSRQLSELLDQADIPHALLNGVQDDDEATIIGRAGVQNAVTISTNMAGRGTDIRPDEESLRCGGLHVIAAEHNLSKRVDRQLSGRAARQGNPGSARFYVCATDEVFSRSESRLPEIIRKHTQADGEANINLSLDIAHMQDELEHTNFLRRREMVGRDHWMESILDTLARQA